MPGRNNEAQELATLIDRDGVRVVEFSLPPQAAGARHFHSHVEEYCYCLSGRLGVELDGRNTVCLEAGEKTWIPAGLVHRVTNRDSVSCRFLVIQGGGVFDFIGVKS